MQRFILTKEHIKLIKQFNVDWDTSMCGAPCVDPKRPYGNGDYLKDIGNTLGIPPDFIKYGEEWYSTEHDEYFEKIHKELSIALQIVFECLTFEPGEYKREEFWEDWEKVNVV